MTLHLEDGATGFSKVYPVGVGEINPKSWSITANESLTRYPLLTRGHNDFQITTAEVNPCRIWWKDPATGKKQPVFAGLPFIKDTAKVPVRVQKEIERSAGGAAVDLPQRWILSECDRDADCNFSGGLCKKNSYSGRGFCTAVCDRYCNYDRYGYPVTFCISDPDSAPNGYCTYKSSGFNYSCRGHDGFARAAKEPRNGQPSVTADVCKPGSTGWIGDRCLSTGDCMAGRFCSMPAAAARSAPRVFPVRCKKGTISPGSARALACRSKPRQGAIMARSGNSNIVTIFILLAMAAAGQRGRAPRP